MLLAIPVCGFVRLWWHKDYRLRSQFACYSGVKSLLLVHNLHVILLQSMPLSFLAFRWFLSKGYSKRSGCMRSPS